MVEQLSYEILKKIDKIEIRKYSSYIVAKIDGFGDRGFNILFQFISGKNTATSEIQMTAPVISEEIEMTTPVLSEKESIAFIMPKKYSINNIPKPIDERIKIIQIPPRIIAALRFSGRWSSSLFNKKSTKLLEILEKQSISIKGPVFSMRYSSPFTPWFLRKNEIAVEISLN